MKRREFIGYSAAAGAIGANYESAHAFTLPDPKQKAQLKISCQEGLAPGETLAAKLDFLESAGYVGLEVGGKDLSKKVTDYQKNLKNRKIKMSAICAGFTGVLISDQESIRKEAMDSIKEILAAAGELNSTGMIMVPAFNGQTKLSFEEGRKILVDEMKELGEYALSVKSRVLLEPLNRKEAFFLRMLADAAAICKDVNSPAVCCMGDFWHMTWEETSDLGGIISAGNYIHHMHIASRKTRNIPGEDEGDNYVDGFRGLKLIGFTDYVSFECGAKGDRAKSLTAAVPLLKKQWEMA